MSNNVTQPWDTPAANTTSTSSTNIYSAYSDLSGSETLADSEKVKYGLGKPTRISIVGDIKHDTN
jgi:hypothetical protein